MVLRNRNNIAAAFLAAACITSPSALAQPIQVNAGEVLTEADLIAGVFNGQPFVLASALFQINAGGRVAPMGSAANPRSWNFASVEVMQGGVFEGDVNAVPGVSDVYLTVHSGGRVGDGANFFDSIINVEQGGQVGNGVWANALAPMTINVNGGEIGHNFLASGGTEFVAINLQSGTIREGFNGYGMGVLVGSGGVMEGGSTDGWSVGLAGSIQLNNFIVTRGDLGISENATYNGMVSESNLQILGGHFAADGNGALIYECVGQMTGGVVGDHVRMFNRADQHPFVISGGQVGNDLELFGGSLTIQGGVVGNDLEVTSRGAQHQGNLLITGGQVGERLAVYSSSTISVEGGLIGDGLLAASGGTVNIQGGSFGTIFAAPQGTINLFVTSAMLDGMQLPLVPGVPYVVHNRGGEHLTAALLDGSAFDLSLFTQPAFGRDVIAADATLTVTLIPSPGGVCVGLCVAGVFGARRRRGSSDLLNLASHARGLG
jgi:hypothetical protein